jgi:hypothetical protein
MPTYEERQARQLDREELRRMRQIEAEWRQARREKAKAGYELDPSGDYLDGGQPLKRGRRASKDDTGGQAVLPPTVA